MKYGLIIILPLLGTTIGSFFVFFLKNKMSENIQKIMSGFASGVMLAASIWSLLIPAIELSNDLKPFDWLPSTIGLSAGVIILILIDKLVYLLNKTKERNNNSLMTLAVTIHNIPEGMAIGVALASLLLNNEYITYTSVLTLTLGITIQNIPEGAIVSLALKARGKKKITSFLIGVLTGIVEPIAIILTLLFSKTVSNFLPYLLAFASGAMIYVIVEELIPDANDGKTKIATISLTIGFIIMMILDVMLG